MILICQTCAHAHTLKYPLDQLLLCRKIISLWFPAFCHVVAGASEYQLNYPHQILWPTSGNAILFLNQVGETELYWIVMKPARLKFNNSANLKCSPPIKRKFLWNSFGAKIETVSFQLNWSTVSRAILCLQLVYYSKVGQGWCEFKINPFGKSKRRPGSKYETGCNQFSR